MGHRKKLSNKDLGDIKRRLKKINRLPNGVKESEYMALEKKYGRSRKTIFRWNKKIKDGGNLQYKYSSFNDRIRKKKYPLWDRIYFEILKGKKLRDISREFGVHEHTVGNIKRRYENELSNRRDQILRGMNGHECN